jgi:hypothetical protein
MAIQTAYTPRVVNMSPTNYGTVSTTRNVFVGSYNVFSTVRQSSNGKITYTTDIESCTVDGVIAYVTDNPGAISLGDTWTISGTEYEVWRIEEAPVLDKTQGEYLSAGVLDVPISNGSTGTVKTYNFDISINTFTG